MCMINIYTSLWWVKCSSNDRALAIINKADKANTGENNHEDVYHHEQTNNM